MLPTGLLSHSRGSPFDSRSNRVADEFLSSFKDEVA